MTKTNNLGRVRELFLAKATVLGLKPNHSSDETLTVTCHGLLPVQDTGYFISDIGFARNWVRVILMDNQGDWNYRKGHKYHLMGFAMHPHDGRLIELIPFYGYKKGRFRSYTLKPVICQGKLITFDSSLLQRLKTHGHENWIREYHNRLGTNDFLNNIYQPALAVLEWFQSFIELPLKDLTS